MCKIFWSLPYFHIIVIFLQGGSFPASSLACLALERWESSFWVWMELEKPQYCTDFKWEKWSPQFLVCVWQLYIHNFRRVMYCELICIFFKLAAIGFNVETVTYKNLKFQVWDLGGQTSIRQEVFISFALLYILRKKPSWRCDVLPPQAVLAVLLLQHRCSDLCGGQQWPRPDGDLQIWAGGHVGG